MKCIRCGTDNNLKDRTANSGGCSKCSHAFVFEPTSMKDVKFTDSFFAKAIADISVNNTLFFTPKQFLYFLDKRLKNKVLPHLGGWTTGFVGGFLSMFLQTNALLPVLIVFNICYLLLLLSVQSQ